MSLEKYFATFEAAICAEITTAITLGGKTIKPDGAKAVLEAKICHSLPKWNDNDRAFTAATLSNSHRSGELQLVDFDHRLEYYNQVLNEEGEAEDEVEDRVCGTIAALEFMDKEEAIAAAAKGKAVPLRAILVAYRKAKGVEQMLKDIADETYNWRTSIEVEYEIAKAALYDTVDKTFYKWSDCTDEMKKLVKPASVGDYKGHKMVYVPGGEDGRVMISGCAFTRWPADGDATIEKMAASKKVIMLNAGWTSPGEYRQAVAMSMKKRNDPRYETDVSKSNPIIGYTDPAGGDGHTHAITKNMLCMPANGHSHYMGMVSIEKESDGIHCAGVTSTRSEWVNGSNGTGGYVEHCHTFDLGGVGLSRMSGVGSKEVAEMDIKERITTLRTTAQTLATSNPAESARLLALAGVMEKENAETGVESVIAERIKNGDLVPKAAHESAVANAAKGVEEKIRKEQEDAKKAEAERTTTIATRMDAIKKANIDPKFVLGKDRTVESVVASIPVGTDGEKMFTERLEEWQSIQKTTGQMVASKKKEDEGTERPAIASTNATAGNAAEKTSLGLC